MGRLGNARRHQKMYYRFELLVDWLGERMTEDQPSAEAICMTVHNELALWFNYHHAFCLKCFIE